MASPMWIRVLFWSGILHYGLGWDGSGRILCSSTPDGAPSSSSVSSSSIWSFLHPPQFTPTIAERAEPVWKLVPPEPS